MRLNIKTATLKDLETLKTYEQKLISFERLLEPSLKRKGAITYYDLPKLLRDKRHTRFFIARVNKQAVGCCFGQIRMNENFYKHRQFGYIGLLYIDQAYRGKDLGKKLIQKTISWFQLKGIKEVRLKVYSGNKASKRFYKKAGFSSLMDELILEI